MGLLSGITDAYRRTAPGKDVTEQPIAPGEKTDGLAADVTPVANGDKDAEAHQSDDEKHPHENLQRGVQQVEAVTIAWSKWSLIAVFLKYVVVAPRHHCLYGHA
jgi:hypothetical protein